MDGSLYQLILLQKKQNLGRGRSQSPSQKHTVLCSAFSFVVLFEPHNCLVGQIGQMSILNIWRQKPRLSELPKATKHGRGRTALVYGSPLGLGPGFTQPGTPQPLLNQRVDNVNVWNVQEERERKKKPTRNWLEIDQNTVYAVSNHVQKCFCWNAYSILFLDTWNRAASPFRILFITTHAILRFFLNSCFLSSGLWVQDKE